MAVKASKIKRSDNRPFWMEKPTFWGKWSLRISLSFIAFLMMFPFVYVLAISFSSYKDVVGGGLIILPANPTLDAYKWVFSSGTVVRALGVSVFLATFGTLINLVMTATLAYSLSRRGVPGRKFILYMVIFTMLFGPGLIPKYLVVKELGLLDTLWSLILIVMRNFFMNIPEELIESARIDGASDPRVLWSIVLPLSKAVLAAIGLFYGVAHWNNFFSATLYINNTELWPVQVVLRQIVLQGQNLGDVDMGDALNAPPPVTIQMATVVVATLPILLVYPFLQKYFVKGILTGSIKG
jgi:putative aldouronate transport system permease protein